MSELDDIKARAAERRERRNQAYTAAQNSGNYASEAEADLDRAIAIAERATDLAGLTPAELNAVKEGEPFFQVVQQRDEARAEVERLTLENRTIETRLVRDHQPDLEKARAAALALRSALKNFWDYEDGPALLSWDDVVTEVTEVMADTAHYEEYR